MSETGLPEAEPGQAEATAGRASAAAAAAPADERLAYRGVFQRLFVRPEIGAIVGAAVIWSFFWAVSRQFGTAGGAASILDVSATLGIMAVAVSLLMIGGEFDLSSGAATGALAITTILLVRDVGELGGAGLSLWVAIPLSLVVALSLGWFNGTMVERTGLPSFIVTLATFFILRGFKLGFSKLAIDNLTVGQIQDGEGYDFWFPVFASTWNRLDHQMDSRDIIYTVGVLGGLALIAFAVAELNFKPTTKANPTGVAVMVAGIVATIAGILYLHNSDGVAANTIGSLIIGVGAVAAFLGLGLWRFHRQNAGSLSLSGNHTMLAAAGIALLALGMILARILDVESQDAVLEMAGSLRWPLVILAAAVAAYNAYRKLSEGDRHSAQSLFSVLSIAVAGGAAIYGFMFMATEQGLRAIVFGAAVAAGMLALSMAVVRGAWISPLNRGFMLTVSALATVALAFFIRNESASVKFRSELFSVLLGAALIMIVWAVISTLFEIRSSVDDGSDETGNLLVKLGLVAVGIGMIIKLLFTTTSEVTNESVTPANFRISILWFLGITIFASWLLGRTKFGSWIFAVGGNKQAARQIGVPAARTKTQLFMLVSVAAWLVGLLLAFRLSTVQSVAGNGLEFEYIIAAVVGGTLLTGGYGSAFGAAIGAIIMVMGRQGIPSARWNSDWRFAFLGLILLAAVIGNNYIKTKAEAGTRAT
ncbi:MAG: ABC transporter permease [Acidimicrobiales bacterium]